MGKIGWKPDDKGRPRRLPASYIMKRDSAARTAFQALRKRGLSREAAAVEIERCFECCWRQILLVDPQPPDPRPECWLLLGEGLPLETIFDLEKLGLVASGGALN